MLFKFLVRFLYRESVFPVTVGSTAQKYKAESVTAAAEISRWNIFLSLSFFKVNLDSSMYSLIRNWGGELGYCRYQKRFVAEE